jgi:hypothetical protein
MGFILAILLGPTGESMKEFCRPTDWRFDLGLIRENVEEVLARNPFAHVCLVHPPGFEQDTMVHARSKGEWKTIFGRHVRMSEFTEFNNEFWGGPLHAMWNDLNTLSPVQVTRLRIATLEPRRCYSLHNDEEIRYHFVVETNSKCLFVVSEDGRNPDTHMPVYPEPGQFELPQFHTFHMPADGQVYALDTNHVHTALNGGDTRRIHLLFETVSWINDR